MKTVKQIEEDIDSLSFEAEGIYESAKRSGRELTSEEAARFDAITDKKSGEIAMLSKQLEEARDRELKIKELSEEKRRERSLAEIKEVTNRPSRVLPQNGVLPNDQSEQPRVIQRMAKLKAFKNDQTAYECGMWMRAVVGREYNRPDKNAEVFCQSRGLLLTNAGNEGGGTAGGYLVPTPLAQTIIDVREEVGVARRICNIQPMTSDTLSIPRRAGGLTVYYSGEGVTMSTSDKTWGQVELTAKKRHVAHQISQELVDDALISVVDDAVSEMAYALADKEDEEIINGDGSSTYGGVLGLKSAIGAGGVATALTGHDTWPELDMGDFTACMGKLPTKYGRAPVWVCSGNFYWTAMMNVMASAGGNSISSLAMGPNGEPRFMGLPVYFTDKMPKTTAAATVCALFGTFSMGVILGDRTGLRVARSDEYAFLNDMTTLKATSRYDFNIHAPGDATNPGAYVALKTAS